jgi:hypothetical protein
MTIKSRTDAITALSQLANVVKWLDGTLSQRLHVTSGGRTYRTITIEFEGDDPFTQIDPAHHAS